MTEDDLKAKNNLVAFCQHFLKLLDNEKFKAKINDMDLLLFNESLEMGLDFIKNNSSTHA